MGSVRSVIAALLILAAIYFATQTDIYIDPRETETLEGVRNLSQRDDLNLLFILIDTLRADHLGSYGYSRQTSPGMDYLAETGIRFARHRAQSSWTKTSMASLWTGLYPSKTGIRRYDHALPETAEMPAEILQDAGFVTAGLWRNGWVAPNFGFQQGFDLYHNPFVQQAPKSLRRAARAGRIDGTDIDVVYSAIEFMRTHADRRWFLYTHFMDVHQYVTIEEMAIFGNRYIDAYDNSILWTDRQVMALTGALEQLGLRERTLVVIASDHGEAFGEHGREGHAADLYGETTLTPLILSFPFILEPGRVVETPSENVDIWPTLLEILGVAPLQQHDGDSLLPQIFGDPDTSEPDIGIAQLDHSWGVRDRPSDGSVAVREGSLRYIHHEAGARGDELYDLANDSRERENLLPELADESQPLKERAIAELEGEAIWDGGVRDVELNELNLRQLRALGYIIEE